MKKRIYYHDSDAGGVVYYANYLKYMEEARIEFFAQLGLCENNLNGNSVFFPVRHCDITYHKPALYGSTIECDAAVLKATAARIVFHQQVTDHPTGRLLSEARITLACVDAQTFRPIRIPESVQKLLMQK